jgi:hypothetical protein
MIDVDASYYRLRVYDRVLSASEIATSFADGPGSP